MAKKKPKGPAFHPNDDQLGMLQKKYNITLKHVKPIQHASQYHFSNGHIITAYHNGSVVHGGTQNDALKHFCTYVLENAVKTVTSPLAAPTHNDTQDNNVSCLSMITPNRTGPIGSIPEPEDPDALPWL